ncbi:MAG: polysaccharide deacetylase family protein [Actinomycetota bacterium]|nr:polysaccharide deacetylase family protein [Actinomycetota bacterium]
MRAVSRTRAWLVLAAVTGTLFTVEAPAFPRRFGVRILTPPKGAIVDAEQRILVGTRGDVKAVTFEWSRRGVIWHPIGIDVIGSNRWATTWQTGDYNGPAIIRATAHGITQRARDRVHVRVVNKAPRLKVSVSPDPFSPNTDGKKDKTTIKIKPNKPVDLTVRVIDRKGRVRRKWKRESDHGEKRKISWWGRGESSRVLADGRYRVAAIARDMLGMKDRAGTMVRLDTRKPRVRWGRISPEPTTGRRRVRFHFALKDSSKSLRMSLHIADDLGPIDRSDALSRRRGRSAYAYRPRYRSGKPLAPGSYWGRIKAWDPAGNANFSRARPWRVYRDVGARVWTDVDEAGRRVALTFDDCDDPGAWRRILGALRRYRAHATFFCPGRQVLSYPHLARRTVREGHSIGSHGWDHAWLQGRSVQDISNRLKKDRNAWWAASGATSVPYFRPPYGASGESVLAAAARTSHYRVILWDVDPSDFRNPSPWYIASRVVSESEPGSIVVMHVRDNTASAVPSMVTGLRRRGLSPVSLHRLFRAAGHQ